MPTSFAETFSLHGSDAWRSCCLEQVFEYCRSQRAPGHPRCHLVCSHNAMHLMLTLGTEAAAAHQLAGPLIMENQMEKNMENEMETAIYRVMWGMMGVIV